MKTKRILITSAGTATAINVISALRRSSRYECHIIAIDRDPLAAGLHLADKHLVVPSIDTETYLPSLLEIIEQHEIDFIFPVFSKEISVFARNKNKFEEMGANLLIPHPETIEQCDNKLRFIEFLDRHGFVHPATYASANNIVGFPVFMKPVKGSSSQNAFRVNNRRELDFYREQFPDSIIQDFMDCPEYTVDCLLSEHQEIIASVIRQRMKIKDGKAVVARTINNPYIEQETRRLLLQLGLIGPCNVQLFLDGDTVCFSEVNPRLAAGGLPLSVESGVNIPELMLRLADGESLTYQDYKAEIVMMRYLTEIFLRQP